ncbi:transposase domain-containing protein [Methylotetracoccus oryzae]|uniref:transposase domain-containing protein n=1 Tax=Methylotetracoccus oryzae TaxID=1919059 RepID=UPI0013A5546C
MQAGGAAGGRGWLLADAPAGAHAGALIYLLVETETVKANGVEPYLWLHPVLRRLPTGPLPNTSKPCYPGVANPRI